MEQEEAAKVHGQIIAHQFLPRQGPGRQTPRHNDLGVHGIKNTGAAPKGYPMADVS